MIKISGIAPPTNTTPVFTQGVPGIDSYAGFLDGNLGNGDFLSGPTSTALPTARYAYVGNVLELSVRNDTQPVHPFHLHGFSMQPLRMVRNSDGVTFYNFNYPEFIDTVNIYPGQTFVFRLRIDPRDSICDLASPAPCPAMAHN